MKFISKFNAIKRCFLLSNYGSRFRDKIVLFSIGLLNQADPAKRILIHKILQYILNTFSENEYCDILINNPVLDIKIKIKLRNKNQADYQSIFECFAHDMYPAPEKEVKYVFDGGANIGFFSLYASFLPNIKKIIMVEPNPDNFSLLKNNIISLVNYIDIHFHQVALFEFKGKALFDIFLSNNCKLSNTPGFGESETKIEVNTESILNLIPSNWDMEYTWIKLDIEGAEYKVLDQLLDSNLRPKTISMEIHDYLNSNGESLIKKLKNAGYSIVKNGFGTSGYVCRQVNATYIN